MGRVRGWILDHLLPEILGSAVGGALITALGKFVAKVSWYYAAVAGILVFASVLACWTLFQFTQTATREREQGREHDPSVLDGIRKRKEAAATAAIADDLRTFAGAFMRLREQAPDWLNSTEKWEPWRKVQRLLQIEVCHYMTAVLGDYFSQQLKKAGEPEWVHGELFGGFKKWHFGSSLHRQAIFLDGRAKSLRAEDVTGFSSGKVLRQTPVQLARLLEQWVQEEAAESNPLFLDRRMPSSPEASFDDFS